MKAEQQNNDRAKPSVHPTQGTGAEAFHRLPRLNGPRANRLAHLVGGGFHLVKQWFGRQRRRSTPIGISFRRAAFVLERATTVYVVLATLIVLLSAASKLASPSHDDSGRRDRVIPYLTQAGVSSTAATMEIAVCCVVALTWRRTPHLALAVLVWLAGALVLYRVGLINAPIGDGGCGSLAAVGSILGERTSALAFTLQQYLFHVGLVLCLSHLLLAGAIKRSVL